MGAGEAFKVSLKEQSAVNCPRKHNLAAQLDDIERKEGREGRRNERGSEWQGRLLQSSLLVLEHTHRKYVTVGGPICEADEAICMRARAQRGFA